MWFTPSLIMEQGRGETVSQSCETRNWARYPTAAGKVSLIIGFWPARHSFSDGGHLIFPRRWRFPVDNPAPAGAVLIRAMKPVSPQTKQRIVRVLFPFLVLAILAVMVWQHLFDSRPLHGPRTPTAYDWGRLKSALGGFEVDIGHYPLGTNGLMDLLRPPPGVTNWHGPYLEKIPKDPWGHVFQYDYPGKHLPNSYDLWSLGPPPGSNGIIGNWQ
jgi:general secretion pathway protein G